MGHRHNLGGIIQEVENLLPEIEQDIERLAIDARNGNQTYGIQSMGYGQTGPGAGGMGTGTGTGMGMAGMSGMGGVPGQMGYMGPYGSTPNVAQMPQLVYVVNHQGSQASQQRTVSNNMIYGQPNWPSGQGYVDPGDGRPAMMFVGQSGYQSRYQQDPLQASQPGYQQTHLPRAPMPFQRGYCPNIQQAPQMAPQQTYLASPQIAQSDALQASQVSPLQSFLPTPQRVPQQSPQSTLQQMTPPRTKQGPWQNPQPLQQGYPAVSQSNLQQSYPVAPQADYQQSPSLTKQTTNIPAGLPPYEVELRPAPLVEGSDYSPNSAFSGPQDLGYALPGSQYFPNTSSGPPLGMYNMQNFPTYLDPGDTLVHYEPTSVKAHDHHHALKALNGSSHSREALTAILGTYVSTKQAHRTSSSTGFSGRCSRPEVQRYDGLLTKLESLSHDYVQKHKSVPPAWVEAVGPYRRQIFAELYNSNELVRAFSQEMVGGPLALPELDTYALGTMKTSNFLSVRASTRPPNLNASFSTLSQVRTVVLIDDSGSMTEPGHVSWGSNGGYPESRWYQARKLLAGMAPVVAMHNSHGIDLHFLNRTPFYVGLRTSSAINSAFDCDAPNNGTPTGRRVNDILDAYMSTLRYYRGLMALNLIVITDGEASDEEILHMSIEEHVTKIVHRGFPAHQFGIDFVQVGDCRYATRHLERLEEEVSRHHHRFQRDVVGVTPATRISDMNPEKMLAILVSGIDARLNGYMRQRGLNV